MTPLVESIKWLELWNELGLRLRQKSDVMELAKLRSMQQNLWFTAQHIDYALNAIIEQYLNKDKLAQWLSKYELDKRNKSGSNIGIICAGNIPMVGFHDLLCTITAGHVALVKLSHKDQFLLPGIVELLKAIDPRIEDQIKFVDKLQDYDAVIATGSNNSLRYFKSYFEHVPHIFRHNRTSVGVIHPEDTDETLIGMASDIFIHFGMGCRNISKFFIPKQFKLDRLFEATLDYSNYILHSKYHNNFIYHTALFQMNKVKYHTNHLIILLETEEWHSPLSVLYYETYQDISEIKSKIAERHDDIQAVYSGNAIDQLEIIEPGKGQQPELAEYADHIDTMDWLYRL